MDPQKKVHGVSCLNWVIAVSSDQPVTNWATIRFICKDVYASRGFVVSPPETTMFSCHPVYYWVNSGNLQEAIAYELNLISAETQTVDYLIMFFLQSTDTTF